MLCGFCCRIPCWVLLRRIEKRNGNSRVGFCVIVATPVMPRSSWLLATLPNSRVVFIGCRRCVCFCGLVTVRCRVSEVATELDLPCREILLSVLRNMVRQVEEGEFSRIRFGLVSLRADVASSSTLALQVGLAVDWVGCLSFRSGLAEEA